MGTLEEVKAEIEEAATLPDLPVAERITRLEAIREELSEAIDIVDEKLAEAQANPDSQRPADVVVAISALRSRAEMAQEQLDSGSLTEADLTEAGIYTLADLTTFEEEGLLETVASELVADGKIDVETGEWVLAEA